VKSTHFKTSLDELYGSLSRDFTRNVQPPQLKTF
jgi:hypothetical protein